MQNGVDHALVINYYRSLYREGSLHTSRQYYLKKNDQINAREHTVVCCCQRSLLPCNNKSVDCSIHSVRGCCRFAYTTRSSRCLRVLLQILLKNKNYLRKTDHNIRNFLINQADWLDSLTRVESLKLLIQLLCTRCVLVAAAMPANV